MKTLYLIRHAKSDWSNPGLKDFDRPINSRGERVAPKMGRELFAKGVQPDYICCSPSKRTRQTVAYICEGIRFNEEDVDYKEEVYEASTGAMLRVINAISDEHNSAMIVGHNPSTSYIAEYLTDEILNNIPTCGVLKINFEIESWKHVSKSTGILEWYIYPKDLNF